MVNKSTRKTILFVSARLPYPALEGHQIRAYGILKQLSKYHDVHLLSILRPGETINYTDELAQCCQSIRGVPLKFDLRENLSAGLRSLFSGLPLVATRYVTQGLTQAFQAALQEIKPDIVHLDLLPLAALAEWAPAQTSIILNEHNVESDLLEQKCQTLTGKVHQWIYRRELKLVTLFEKQACQRADITLACSDADKRALISMGAREVHTIPNGVNTDVLRPQNQDFNPNHLVFLGGMGWYPNRLGVEWFTAKVLPKIVAFNPATHLHLIGNPEPAASIPAQMRPYITVHGFVDDFRPLVGSSGIMIVPLHVGSGTRLKVVESAALGCCMVATHKGAEGVALIHNESVIFADNPDEFAQAVLALQQDKNAITRIGKNARIIAQEIYDWSSIGHKLHSIYSNTPNIPLANTSHA
ncbi:MAG: glycosyltransferase [Oceanospirillaceae bacterium]|nr:glycosyltransferase [Oceanospirillaceae bacterium]MCP5335217.1 glycosyltransferase [Oceanospirillaceae bacterium]